ncbi:hypothetical protein LEMLEM_LOCUS8782, partial [Lemmus lemmus]
AEVKVFQPNVAGKPKALHSVTEFWGILLLFLSPQRSPQKDVTNCHHLGAADCLRP